MDIQAILDETDSSQSSVGMNPSSQSYAYASGGGRHEMGLGLDLSGVSNADAADPIASGAAVGGRQDYGRGSDGHVKMQYSNALEAAMRRTTSNMVPPQNPNQHAAPLHVSTAGHNRSRPAPVDTYTRQISALTTSSFGPTACVDLEQILQEDDDDDDDDDDDLDNDEWRRSRMVSDLPTASSYNPYTANTAAKPAAAAYENAPPTTITQTRHNAEDWDVLQAILGEDDDDDEDGDAHAHAHKSANGGNHRMTHDDDDSDDDIRAVLNRAKWSASFADDNDADDDDDDPVHVYSLSEWKKNANLSANGEPSHYSSHILDAILNSEDDDDDGDLGFGTGTDLKSGMQFNAGQAGDQSWKQPIQGHHGTLASPNGLVRSVSNHSFTTDIDNSTLATTEQHGLLPVDHPHAINSAHVNTEMDISAISVGGASSSAFGLPTTNIGGMQLDSTIDAAAALRSAASPIKAMGGRHAGLSTLSPMASPSPSMRGTNAQAEAELSESELREASKRSLEIARLYEQKLMKSGHRDIVSPLMVKRRLKPRVELPTKQRLSERRIDPVKSNAPSGGASASKGNASGVNRAAARLLTVSTTTATPGSGQSSSTIPASSLNMPKFNFSGVLDENMMPGIHKELIKNQAAYGSLHSTNLPTALAVNSRFIAIGTQNGVILVFDLFEVLRHSLGATRSGISNNDSSNAFSIRKAGSVTSIDLNSSNADVLVAGYTSGWIVLWDIIKGTVIRTCADVHASPLSTVRFSATDFRIVSVDAAGLVNKVTFTKNMLWNSYSYDTECLLDGTAGQILAMDVLTPLNVLMQNQASSSKTLQDLAKTRSYEPLKHLVLIALSSERSSFAVAVEPTVNVLHRWSKPPQERVDPLEPSNHSGVEDGSSVSAGKGKGTSPTDNDAGTDAGRNRSTYLPCLSWGWALVQGGGNTLTPILARSWGCCIQLLRASYPMLEDDELAGADGPAMPDVEQWPAFGLQDEFEVSSPVVAMKWLNDRSLIYLTINNEFTVVDTVMMTLLERLDFSGLQLTYAEFRLSKSIGRKDSGLSSKSQSIGGDTRPLCATFQNSIQSWDDRLLVLCQSDVKTVSIVGAKRRISALEQDGEWLEALALALNHYENTIKSQENRRRNPTGRNSLSQHPEFSKGALKSEDEEWIAKLLIRYLNIAMENAPDAQPIVAGEHFLDLATSHFQMLAGVCMEYCVVTRRLDLLFGPIFHRFHSVGYLNVFLDVLEPYILNDKLDYIAPEAMAHFIEHCRATNGIATVERCLLHMNVTIMDFDSILGLLRANEMYSALFYVFNQGLNDYTTPLEILMEKIFDAADTSNLHRSSRRLDGVPNNELQHVGYKAIAYLQSCFQGRTFPQDADITPKERIQTLRPELLRLLLQEQFTPSPNIKAHQPVIGSRALRYPYTQILIMVDPIAMFQTMAMALDAPDSEFRAESNFESIGGWEIEVDGSTEIAGDGDGDGGGSSANKIPDRQQVVSMFLSIILPENADDESKLPTQSITALPKPSIFQARSTVNAFLDFLAEYLMKGVVRVNKVVAFMILERMAKRYEACTDASGRQHAQGRIISLITALPRNSYETDEVLGLVEKSGIHRAALILHQEGASSWHDGMHPERQARHFQAAIDSYLEDEDESFRLEVFAYAKKECPGSTDVESNFDAAFEPKTLRDALAFKLRDLVRLSPLMTAELVSELFVEDLEKVIGLLDNTDSGKVQFMFLQTIISGELNQKDSVAGSVLTAQLTTGHHHRYLELMADLYPDSVYDYLSTHDNYRPEQCLELCQRRNIADASAYLLERMGNVTSALQLILQTLESRMMNLKRTVRGLGTDFFRQHSATLSASRWRKSKASSMELYGKQEKDVEGVKKILIVALDLCERNSGSFNSQTEHGSQLWFNVLDRLINAKSFLRLTKEQPSHAGVISGVLGDLLRLTMQRMVSSVPLPDLVRKVTSDHSGSDIGELRQLVSSLLSTYGLELNVFQGAVSAFKQDVRSMERKNQKLKVSGSGVRSILSVELDNVAAVQNQAILESTASRGDILQLTEGGKATIAGSSSSLSSSQSPAAAVTGTSDQQSRGGLATALSRLRTRRQRRQVQQGPQTETVESNTAPLGKNKKAALNMMSVMEQKDMREERSSDDAYFEERCVGVMGEAQHRGRLMSFIY